MARNKFDIDERLTSPFTLKHIKRAFYYINHYKKSMLMAMTFSAASTVFGLMQPLATKQVVDVYVPEGNIPGILITCLIFGVCIFMSILTGLLRSKIMNKVSQSIIYEIRHDMFTHLQELPFAYFDSRPHGKILVRIVNYVNSVSETLSNGIINIVLEVVNVLFIAGFMLALDVRLSLVVMSGMPLLLAFVFAIKTRQRRAWQDYSAKSSNLNAYIHESLSGMRVTQAFTREKENAGIFRTLCKDARRLWLRCTRIVFLMPFVVDNIAAVVFCMVYVMGIRWLGGAVSLGTVIAMAGYAWRFWIPIQNMGNLYNSFVNTMAYLERIFEMLDEPVDITDRPDAYELPPIKGSVEFGRVNFAYDENIRVLHDVNFKAEAGESIAFVGPTGSGKTTVVNLMSRFYGVSDGAISIDGHDISAVTLRSLRSQMGIMLQDSFIFSGTLMDNIRYGRLDASDEEVIAASKVTRAHDFIVNMKDGYNTVMNERGAQLSAGQKQLVAFARTLLADPRILVLDEATSAIDTQTEHLLQEGLKALLEGRTSFIIAHRLSTIQNCGRIMYIENGKIMECGSHDELMSQQGLYYKLFMSQVV